MRSVVVTPSESKTTLVSRDPPSQREKGRRSQALPRMPWCTPGLEAIPLNRRAGRVPLNPAFWSVYELQFC